MKKSITLGNLILKTIIVLVLLVFVLTTKANAQNSNTNKNLKIFNEIGTHVSANGHGVFYYANMTLNKGRHNFTFGPSLQKQTNIIRAGRLNYSFTLYGPGNEYLFKREYEGLDFSDPFCSECNTHEEKIQLNAFLFGNYFHNLPLGKGYIKDEYQANRIENYNWTNARLSTVEFGFGFEFRYKLGKKINWKNTISAVFVHHNKYINNMYHQQNFSTIGVSTGIEFGN